MHSEYLLLSLCTDFSLSEVIFTSQFSSCSPCFKLLLWTWAVLRFKPGGCDKNMIIEQAWFSFHQVFSLDWSAVGSLRKALGTHSHTAVERLTEMVHRFLWSMERITWYRATGCKIASLTSPGKVEFYNELLNSLTLPYTDFQHLMCYILTFITTFWCLTIQVRMQFWSTVWGKITTSCY